MDLVDFASKDFFSFSFGLQSNECRKQPHENSELCHLQIGNITAHTFDVAHALFCQKLRLEWLPKCLQFCLDIFI